MKKKILNIILIGLCVCFIILFILGFISSRSLKSASAEYYPSQSGYLIDNSTFATTNLLAVTQQYINYSEYGFSYPDSTQYPIDYSVFNSVVTCNGNFYFGGNNAMRLNSYERSWSYLGVSGFVTGVGDSGLFRCYLLYPDGSTLAFKDFNVYNNEPAYFQLDFTNLNYTGQLYLSMGWWTGSTLTSRGSYIIIENFLITDNSNFAPVLPCPSYCDVAYFKALDNRNVGYNQGYTNGYAIGFDEALDVGEVSSGNFFSRVLDILDVKIFGFVSLGDMFKVLFGVSIVIILLKLFVGG